MADTWLFAGPDASVFIVRTGSMAVEVCGPGGARASRLFNAETELVAFLSEADRTLVASGYRPRGYAANRRLRQDRRERWRADDRRRSSMIS